MAADLVLEVGYDFDHQELVIDFRTIGRARMYRLRNSEARILHHVNKNHLSQQQVLLPKPSAIRYIRSSSMGLGLQFTSEEAASQWCSTVFIGCISAGNKKEVVIKRYWKEQEFDQTLQLRARWGIIPSTLVTPILASQNLAAVYAPPTMPSTPGAMGSNGYDI